MRCLIYLPTQMKDASVFNSLLISFFFLHSNSILVIPVWYCPCICSYFFLERKILFFIVLFLNCNWKYCIIMKTNLQLYKSKKKKRLWLIKKIVALQYKAEILPTLHCHLQWVTKVNMLQSGTNYVYFVELPGWSCMTRVSNTRYTGLGLIWLRLCVVFPLCFSLNTQI